MRSIVAISMFAMVGVAHAGDDGDPSDDQGVGGALQSWSSVPVAEGSAAADGSVHLWGQLQTWVTLADQDTNVQADPATYGDPEADPGFSIARARFGIDGFLPGADAGWGQVDYAVSVGVGAPYDALSTFDSSSVQIVDAFGRWASPQSFGTTSVAFGVQRVPFSRDAMISSARLVFQERAVGTAWLVPGRDAGAVVGQSVQFTDDPAGPQLLLRGGAFNGNGALFGDADPGLMASVRGEFLLGQAYQTWSHDLEPALGVGSSYLSNRELATTTNALEADLLARYKWVTVSGELVQSTITLGNSDVVAPPLLSDTTRLAWQAQVSVFTPLPRGGIELAGRYATLDDDQAYENLGDVQLLHAGLTWRDLVPGFDVGGGYIHREETPTFANDSVRLWLQVRPSAQLL